MTIAGCGPCSRPQPEWPSEPLVAVRNPNGKKNGGAATTTAPHTEN